MYKDLGIPQAIAKAFGGQTKTLDAIEVAIGLTLAHRKIANRVDSATLVIMSLETGRGLMDLAKRQIEPIGKSAYYPGSPAYPFPTARVLTLSRL